MSLLGKNASTGKFDAIAQVTDSGAIKVAIVAGSLGDTSPTTVSIITATAADAFAAFPSTACSQLDIVNTDAGAVDIEYRRGGSGAVVTIPAGTGRMIVGITNANSIEVRRADLSAAGLTISAEAIS